MKDDIVISGISGRYPESDNVEEFKKNLFEGVDMVTEDDRRWKAGLFDTPRGMGKIKDIFRFDYEFFGFRKAVAEDMDPGQRILCEVVYEAIFDSGYTPSSMAGQKIGIFLGCCGPSYQEDVLSSTKTTLGNFVQSIGFMSNRVSFSFNFKGPSFAIDTGCSSSLQAMNEALLAMRAGQCEAAIVAGCRVNLKFSATSSLHEISILSPDSRSKTFDKSANGFVRSEAVCAVFLQKLSNAKRCYATVLHCEASCDGYKEKGITHPSANEQKDLFLKVYRDLGINPNSVAYVEAHGTGSVVGDFEEGSSIGAVFCGGRKTPLLVGSVKTNAGHAESASGIVGVTKLVIAMEEGMIPANLHFKVPNPNIPALCEGHFKVVSEHTPFPTGGIVGLNNYGVGGTNVHLVLRSTVSRKYQPAEIRTVPRLVLSCGRTAEAVRHVLQTVQEKRFNDEALALLEEASKTEPTRMTFRGYSLLKDMETNTITVQECQGEPRPVWFLYSGMGSQWSGMAKEMMNLEPFAKSIRRSAMILQPLGVDLMHLLTQATDEELNHIVAPFVTLAAVQIALTEMLISMGIIPDGLVGHSVGELGCAFADGCLNSKEFLLTAYWRGKSCEITDLIYGKMAVIGMTWSEAQEKCPEGIFAVCHNAEDSVTVSGPGEQMEIFLAELRKDNFFVREVNTGEIAFHSKYVQPASMIMRQELQKVITSTRRSPKWVSSSVPEDNWNSESAQFSSVDYHINNLLSPVLFHEAMSHVPKNALIIEIAPHSLLEAIVRRIMGPECAYIGLMNRRKPNCLDHYLQAVGRLYTFGLNPCVRNLYKPVVFPVSRGTPMLNSLVVWDHKEELRSFDYHQAEKNKDVVLINTMHPSHDFLLDHKVNGRVLYPATGYLWQVWKSFATSQLAKPEELAVVFEDVRFHGAVILPNSGIFKFHVKVLDGTGLFQISEGDRLLVTGSVRKDETTDKENIQKGSYISAENNTQGSQEEIFTLDADSFYKELRLRGYHFGKYFQGVTEAHSNGTQSMVKWEGNWIRFLDSVLQVGLLRQTSRVLFLPSRLRLFRIDPTKRPQNIGDEMKVVLNPWTNSYICGPIEVQGLHIAVAQTKQARLENVCLEKYGFQPYKFNLEELSAEEETEIEEYVRVTSSLAYKTLIKLGKQEFLPSVMNSFKPASDNLIQQCIEKNEEAHVLLRTLHKILSKGDPKVENSGRTGAHEKQESAHFHSAEMDFNKDFLSQISFREPRLSSFFSIILDNMSKREVHVLEVSHKHVIYQEFTKCVRKMLSEFVDKGYTIASMNENELIKNIEGSESETVRVLQISPDNPSLPEDVDLILTKDIFVDNSFSLPSSLEVLVNKLRRNGFLLLTERRAFTPAEKTMQLLQQGRISVCQNEITLEEEFARLGLSVIVKQKDASTFVTYLLRKTKENILDPVIFRLNETSDCKWVDELKLALNENEKSDKQKNVWIVAENEKSGVVGLMNSLRVEEDANRFSFFLNASLPGEKAAPTFDLEDPIIQDIVKKDLRSNVYRSNSWGFYTRSKIPTETALVPKKDSFLHITELGNLSSLKWTESPLKFWTPSDKSSNVKVKVFYSALNFRDVMLATGKIKSNDNQPSRDTRIGFEFSGVETETGRRVMGVVPLAGHDRNALACNVVCPRETLLDVPPEWTLEEACTVPVVYMTAIYSLTIRAKLKERESVLIHAGSGGVGQAAISLCLHMGCQVYTTVGSEEKKEFLLKRFPQLKVEHIFNSRTLDFEFDLLSVTRGAGVDVILNSLAEKMLHASLRCLKTNGRFIELGLYDVMMDNPLGLLHFAKNVDIQGVSSTVILESANQKDGSLLMSLVKDAIKSGIIRPLNTNVFQKDSVEDAFRFLASGKHVGKVVVKIRDEIENDPSLKANVHDLEIPSVPRTYFNPVKSVVVTGGLGGFGFELCHWLVERGVKYLLISARSGIKNGYQKLWIQRWTRSGVKVKISNQDITNLNGCMRMLQEAREMGPVGSIFHLAMVLRNGLFNTLTPEAFKEVCDPKLEIAKHLDTLSRDWCPRLEHFCAFSTAVSSAGVPGLTSYGYASSAVENLIEHRRSVGLPGQAIQWGVIDEVGTFYEDYRGKFLGSNNWLMSAKPQSLSSSLITLDKLMQENVPISVSTMLEDESVAKSHRRKNLLQQLNKIIGIKTIDKLNPEDKLSSLGLDSLRLLEVKHILEEKFHTNFSVREIQKLKIGDLKGMNDETWKKPADPKQGRVRR